MHFPFCQASRAPNGSSNNKRSLPVIMFVNKLRAVSFLQKVHVDMLFHRLLIQTGITTLESPYFWMPIFLGTSMAAICFPKQFSMVTANPFAAYSQLSLISFRIISQSIHISPWFGSSKPVINLNKVLFPDPLAPIRETNSPGLTSIEIFEKLS